ncbi:MAG: hypothetical protein GF410_10370 [Chitinivibrionales bacterium]|nr:hypothetical protein [Chitinivibrionales bacterium]
MYIAKKWIWVLLAAAVANAQSTENVIIAVIDGARHSETFGDDGHQYIPRIWNELRPLGTIYTSFYNDGQTSTCNGHSSIVTGTWQYMANDGSERPDKPTIFEYRRKQLSSPAEDNAVVLGKDKLDILSYSTHVDYGAQYAATVKAAAVDGYDDVEAMANLFDVLANQHPALTILNLPEVDQMGHTGDWNGYVNAIHDADSMVAEIWSFVEQDAHYAGKTTLIVTNDHGRHLDGVQTGFRDHGCDCDGCRHIMALIIGPEFDAGVTETTRWTQIDLAPTIGALVGFDTPLADGSAMPFNEITATLVQSANRTRATAAGPGCTVTSASSGIRISSLDARHGLVRLFDARGVQIARHRHAVTGEQLAVRWEGIAAGVRTWCVTLDDGRVVSGKTANLR